MNKKYLLLLLIVPASSFGMLAQRLISKRSFCHWALENKKHVTAINGLTIAHCGIKRLDAPEAELEREAKAMKIARRRSRDFNYSLFYLNKEVIRCERGSLLKKLMQRAINQDKELKELRKEKKELAKKNDNLSHELDVLQLVIEKMGKEGAQAVNELTRERDDLYYRLQESRPWWAYKNK